jgi:hypothetical protein
LRTQSTKRAPLVPGLPDSTLDFVFFRADPMSFVPVNLRLTNRTISKLDLCGTFQLPPASFAVILPQPPALAYRGASCDDPHVRNRTDNLEVHQPAPLIPTINLLRAPARTPATPAAVATAIPRHNAAAEAARGSIAQVDDAGQLIGRVHRTRAQGPGIRGQ